MLVVLFLSTFTSSRTSYTLCVFTVTVIWSRTPALPVETVPAARSCLQVFTSFFSPLHPQTVRSCGEKQGSHSPLFISLRHLCNCLPPHAAARSCFPIWARSDAPQKCAPVRRETLSLSLTHARKERRKVGDPAVWLTSLPGGTRGVDFPIFGACARVPFCAGVLRTCARAGS